MQSSFGEGVPWEDSSSKGFGSLTVSLQEHSRAVGAGMGPQLQPPEVQRSSSAHLCLFVLPPVHCASLSDSDRSDPSSYSYPLPPPPTCKLLPTDGLSGTKSDSSA